MTTTVADGFPGLGRDRLPWPGLAAALLSADPRVVDTWSTVTDLAAAGAGCMGLAAGERPAADVEVLGACLASIEYGVAVFLHAAAAAGCVPLGGPGAMLTAAGWSGPWARRLARAGALIAEQESLGRIWAAGRITSDHVDPIARRASRFTPDELAAVVTQLEPLWGQISPAAVDRFVQAADRMLHPPDDPDRPQQDVYQTRSLSFAVTRDLVLITGELPRIEGEAVMAAIEALAERMRSTVEHVPAAARRADALVELVNTASAAGALPNRGGLPVALTVTVEHTSLGDPVVTSSRGHLLTDAETRWACCDAQVTPVLVDGTACVVSSADHSGGAACAEVSAQGHGPAARSAALAALLFDTRIPLAVGRTSRTATPAQRRALAVRDKGCIVPGCPVPAETCQAHHLTDWAQGGETDISNLALLCWAHHRQVDLHMWTITPDPPGRPPQSRPNSGPGGPANQGAPFTISRTPRHSWRT